MAKKKEKVAQDFSLYNNWKLLDLLHEAKRNGDNNLAEEIHVEFSKRDMVKVNQSIRRSAEVIARANGFPPAPEDTQKKNFDNETSW